MDTQFELHLNRILSLAAEQGASDIHFSAGNPPFFRIQGRLLPVPNEDIITTKTIQDILARWLDEKTKVVFEKEKEVIFSFHWENRARFKAVVYQESGRPAISLRLISNTIPTPQELGLPQALQTLVELEKGLVIVAGTFGSGRSTTLASLVHHLNSVSERHIITLEQPIEYVFIDNKSIIEQREVGRDTPSFLKGLEFVLDEDVDVVMVSDLNDPDVLQSAFHVVHSGRLVLGAVDADSSRHVIEKVYRALPDTDEARRDFAEILAGIVVQRMLPRVGGGQVLAAEIVLPNQPIKSLIQSKNLAQMQSVIETSRYEGMVSMNQSVQTLASQGLIKEAPPA